MGFLYIVAVVLAILTVAMMGKLSGRKGVPSLDLTFVIFCVASVLGALMTYITRIPSEKYVPLLFPVAFIAGMGGSLAVFTFNQAIRLGHFGFSNAIYRSSFLMPILFALLFFGAALKLSTGAGILLILVAVFLMSWSNDAFAKGASSQWKWFLIIFLSFLLSGLPRIGQLMTSKWGMDFYAYLFLSYLGGVLVLLPFYWKKVGFDKRAWGYGSVAAVASYIGVYCTLSALKLLPASVVYPITLSGPIILGMLISGIFFKERIRWAGWIGVLAGISGISILTIWK